MRYDGEHIVTDYKKRAKTDQSLNGLGTYKQEDRKKIADEIIKNTYRTLMTRGQKGCYVYCEDKQLAQYLKYRINKTNEVTYTIDEDEEKYELKVAEEGEKYRYE